MPVSIKTVSAVGVRQHPAVCGDCAAYRLLCRILGRVGLKGISRYFCKLELTLSQKKGPYSVGIEFTVGKDLNPVGRDFGQMISDTHGIQASGEDLYRLVGRVLKIR